MNKNENLTGYLFLSPALIIFISLVAFPLLFSVFLSFTEWNFLSGWSAIEWVGFGNFHEMFTADNRFVWGIKNTFIYAIATVPVLISLSLVLAYLLNGKIYAKKALRLAFFIPYISSAVALSSIFKALFRENGIINNILSGISGREVRLEWFADFHLNMIPIILFVIWVQIGFQLVIYMAAMQNVPRSLYEAAELDGASEFQKFTKITFPIISPTTFYLVVIQLITCFKIFTAIHVMNFGNIPYSNTSIVVEIFRNAFGSYKFGYASAEAMVLFVIIILVTVLNFWGQKKWVHY